MITIDSESGTVTLDIRALSRLIEQATTPQVSSGVIRSSIKGWRSIWRIGRPVRSPTSSRKARPMITIDSGNGTVTFDVRRIAKMIEAEGTLGAPESAKMAPDVSQPVSHPERATATHVRSRGTTFENLTDNEFEERVKDVFDAMLDLLMSKRHSYGVGNLTTHGLQGILVRMSDKLYRLQTMLDRDAYGSLDGDSMDDAFRDLTGYSVLGLIFAECERRDRFGSDSR